MSSETDDAIAVEIVNKWLGVQDCRIRDELRLDIAQTLQSARLQGMEESADIAKAVGDDLLLSARNHEGGLDDSGISAEMYTAKAGTARRIESAIRHRAASPQGQAK